MIKFEEYNKDFFDLIPQKTYAACMMHETERRFLAGLLTYHKPKNILEVGVSRGGGSALILKCLEENSNSPSLISIDKATTTAWGSVGKKAIEAYADNPEFLEKHWALISGNDPSQVIRSFDKKFDFCLIDTAHIHPVETLNFLTILPFLEDGAVVVIHDIGIHCIHTSHFNMFPRNNLACAILYYCVVGDKFRPFDKNSNSDYLEMMPFTNIGAFYVIPDTRKYIKNVFLSLEFPWGLYPEMKDILAIHSIIAEHYDNECLRIFENACEINKRLADNDFTTYFSFNRNTILNKLSPYKRFSIFVANMGTLLARDMQYFKQLKLPLPYVIYDSAPICAEVEGIPVRKSNPDEIDFKDGEECVVFVGDNTKFTEMKTSFKRPDLVFNMGNLFWNMSQIMSREDYDEFRKN